MPTNSEKAYTYFREQGLNPAAAAGLVGNLYVESGGFSPDVIEDRRRGDGGIAHGIAQWHPDRWNPLVALSHTNTPPFYNQLAYVVRELKQRQDWIKGANGKLVFTGKSQFDALNSRTDARQAAAYTDAEYEASAGTARTARENAAAEAYSNNGKISGSSSGGGDAAVNGQNAGDVGGVLKDDITGKLTGGLSGALDFAKGKLFEAGIGVLAVLAVLAGLIFIVMSTKAGKGVASIATHGAV